ncbi:hypothetical protein GMORB2_3549 [Geosmithia morbida]|uniref:Uncharacterized protein n=1 Tax=Geosmithia morbida TaxID=1094350 RepID=A0A9P4YQP5_9HYPO|nr:uncharacterized protein GMORB2_3549 [Geosmithia morbida]KAF4119861.1 hypothetical protein GMORB2_3549 [Geosmithia morbida]
MCIKNHPEISAVGGIVQSSGGAKWDCHVCGFEGMLWRTTRACLQCTHIICVLCPVTHVLLDHSLA